MPMSRRCVLRVADHVPQYRSQLIAICVHPQIVCGRLVLWSRQLCTALAERLVNHRGKLHAAMRGCYCVAAQLLEQP